ncbi:non-LEE-encoded effector EspJ [Escherichia coli]|nr:non-LEE-encoded effector EspJ [Escherichia coli]
MSIIKNCLSLINNALNIQKTSYPLTKMEQAGKLLNRKITPEKYSYNVVIIQKCRFNARKKTLQKEFYPYLK